VGGGNVAYSAGPAMETGLFAAGADQVNEKQKKEEAD
jgi:hypothetical protein